MDLIDEGKKLRFASHMDVVAEKFSDSDVFRHAMK